MKTKYFRILVGVVLIACATWMDGMILRFDRGLVEGRVIETDSGQGIPSLVIKLAPPKASKLPIRITNTDVNGGFSFTKVEDGKYLLEVYQGLTLLYRDVIDTTRPSGKAIELSRK